MTPELVDLIRKSFDALWPVRRQLGHKFDLLKENAGEIAARSSQAGYVAPSEWIVVDRCHYNRRISVTADADFRATSVPLATRMPEPRRTSSR
jgi:hypothetical protein